MIALIDDYQKELADILSFAEKTVENYVSCIKMFTTYIKEKYSISPTLVQGKQITEWMSYLKKTGISYSRIQHHISALKTFYAFLLKINLVKKNSADALKHFHKKNLSKVKPITSQTAKKLLNAVDQSTWLGKRNYIIISILWALGLRISELTRLNVGSFESSHDPKKKIGLLRVKGKNRKQRALFVVDKLYENILSYLANPDSPKRKKDPLFPVQSGKSISDDRVQRMIKEYCRSADITERVTPHVLRHSFATEMYHQKVPITAIQAMMGHDKPAETAIYIKVNDIFKKEALFQLSIYERMPWQ